jgi:hypothetical protein
VSMGWDYRSFGVISGADAKAARCHSWRAFEPADRRMVADKSNGGRGSAIAVSAARAAVMI